MAKTCDDYLLKDILVHRTSRFRSRMLTVHGTLGMDVEIQTGHYKGLQYYCIIKDRNQGKRDSFIVARSFLYNFNRRHESPATSFMPEFFGHMCSFLTKTAGIHQVECLIGMTLTRLLTSVVFRTCSKNHVTNTPSVFAHTWLSTFPPISGGCGLCISPQNTQSHKDFVAYNSLSLPTKSHAWLDVANSCVSARQPVGTKCYSVSSAIIPKSPTIF